MFDTLGLTDIALPKELTGTKQHDSGRPKLYDSQDDLVGNIHIRIAPALQHDDDTTTLTHER